MYDFISEWSPHNIYIRQFLDNQAAGFSTHLTSIFLFGRSRRPFCCFALQVGDNTCYVAVSEVLIVLRYI